jgi:hypothetical protein
VISTIEPSEIRETEIAMPVLVRFEKNYLEKHAPGKHNQQNHAGGRGGGSGETSVGLFLTPTKAGRSDYREYQQKVAYYTEDEQFQSAAQQWQGENYRRVQGGLLSGEPSEDAQFVIDKFDENMASLVDYDGYLYRGQTEGLDNLKVGDSFVSPLFQSTTTDPITAAGFSKSSGGVIGGIREGESATILRIDGSDAKGVLIPDSQEFEIVLARGTTYTVDYIQDKVMYGVNMKIIDLTAETPDE